MIKCTGMWGSTLVTTKSGQNLPRCLYSKLRERTMKSRYLLATWNDGCWGAHLWRDLWTDSRVSVCSSRGRRPFTIKSKGHPFIGPLLFSRTQATHGERGHDSSLKENGTVYMSGSTALWWKCWFSHYCLKTHLSLPGYMPSFSFATPDPWIKWTMMDLWVLKVTRVPKFLIDLQITALWVGLSWWFFWT